ncbi:MAG: MFS transporter [Ignavibacteriae bacterium]|nr:MAG: MFS transporter [Ignavibacteriota bacterium]
MNDLIIVFVGLALILYIFFVLGTARLAIQKNLNSVLLTLAALLTPIILFYVINYYADSILLKILSVLIVPALTFAHTFFSSNKFDKTDSENEKNYFENIIMELTQPFIDLAKTSQALLGINISYVLEGLSYFGVVGLLAIFFNDSVGLNDIQAGNMVGVLTAGITISMLFLGATVDWIGLRKALLIALFLMLIGRVFLSLSPALGVPGLWNSSHLIAMLGILGIILGYGIYQPACYAGVKVLTDEKTAAMGYAMLYALMNLGGFLPGIISPPVRKSFGIDGVFWVYAALTVVGIGVVYFFITKKAYNSAVNELQDNTKQKDEEDKEQTGFKAFQNVFVKQYKEKANIANKLLIGFGVLLILTLLKEYIIPEFFSNLMSGSSILISVYETNWIIPILLIALSILIYIITDLRFYYFIFILIFVQTLFAHNWLTIPQYTSRAFDGFVGENFEFFVNLNPILIFILTPMVTALTSKKDTYNMMIIGTFIMALPTFFLALGPSFPTLMAYLFIMTIGEAMWQPRFLQWVAEIAPKNMTGIYMGIGQFPWFLTKVITSLYSGWFLMNYCPANTPISELNTETMWFIYGIIAMVSPIGLFLAKSWMKKGFKTKHEE